MTTYTTYTITLKRIADSWYAQHTDPAVMDLFGTDTVPTAYRACMTAEEVLRRIQALNPELIVRLG